MHEAKSSSDDRVEQFQPRLIVRSLSLDSLARRVGVLCIKPHHTERPQEKRVELRSRRTPLVSATIIKPRPSSLPRTRTKSRPSSVSKPERRCWTARTPADAAASSSATCGMAGVCVTGCRLSDCKGAKKLESNKMDFSTISKRHCSNSRKHVSASRSPVEEALR